MHIDNPDLSIEEAVNILGSQGNEILKVEGRNITVLNTKTHPTEAVWVCDYCPTYSKSREKVELHEKECCKIMTEEN